MKFLIINYQLSINKKAPTPYRVRAFCPMISNNKSCHIFQSSCIPLHRVSITVMIFLFIIFITDYIDYTFFQML